MHLKKYEVASISEGMERIRRDLGSDAVILSSRRIGSGKTARIEIVAARERDDDAPATESERTGSCAGAVPEGHGSGREERWGRFESRLNDIHDMLYALAAPLKLSDREGGADSMTLYSFLVARGVAPPWAIRLLESIRGTTPVPACGTEQKALLKEAIRRSADDCPEPVNGSQGRIRAFVGPAGDGKTTTLAKMAAGIRYHERKTLGIVTMDTFRIGAVEQLKIYGEIMGVPVMTVSGEDTLAGALRSFEHMDRILVDTPGRSRSEGEYVPNLRKAFSGAVQVEAQLVLSAAAGEKAQADAVERFRPLDYVRIIMTKIDDARDYGCLYNVMKHAGRPVSHITTGQQVPQDIRAVNGDGIANLIVDGTIPRQ